MLEQFWHYPRTSFPLLRQSFLIAVAALCGVTFSMLARQADQPIGLPTLLSILHWFWTFGVAFVSTLGFFFQLWVATEHHVDCVASLLHADYLAWRQPLTRRQLISWLGVIMLVQLVLAVWLQIVLLFPLLLIWGYLGLIDKEFFMRPWLKRYPLAYPFAQLMLIPLLFFYITACDWLVIGAAPPVGLAWFLISGFFCGLIFEIGCKIRAPQDEEAGVDTYSKWWGRRTAVTGWVFAIALTGISLTFAAATLRTSILLLALAFSLLTGAVLIGERFLETPRTLYAGSIQKFSTLCMVLLYLGLAVMPLFFV